MDKKYDHIKFEQEARQIWEENKTYLFDPASPRLPASPKLRRTGRRTGSNSKKEIYSIDTPPPTVSGSLHIGHVFSYIHTDLIARYKRMSGLNVFYPMGFDDNGLPTERFVEKKNKTKATLMKRSEFIDLCLKESKEVEKTFEKLWKNLALSIDWTKTYTTISKKARRISQYSFIELYKKNLAYKKEEASLYCTTCQTSVAQAEIDNREVKSKFSDIEFKTEPTQWEDGEQLIISTTRPELIPACVAVFYNPKDKRYKILKGKNAVTPIFNKKVPILPDDKVDMEKGTGLVMCCTFGDQTDIYWQKKHKLPFVQVVGLDGKWTELAGPLQGLRAQEARKKMIELLKEDGTLLDQKDITHTVNTHERCKQEIEYQILSQWFIKILDHKDKFLQQAEKINWYPNFMKSRYIDWVKNLSWDWCISRQRFYGIPFPIWYCNECNEIIVADEKDLPIDPQEEKYPGKKCPKCNSEDLKPDTDVMDTWNTSSLTPQININWPINDQGIKIPMGLRPQAHDIIRTWALYTIIKAYFHEKEIPWNDIVISGHVLAGKEKISKSKGGAKLTPEFLLQTYPADVIRYWSANGKLGTDTAFSENQLKIGQKLITKIWNAFRFCSDHISEYEKQKPQNLDDLSKWLLHKFSNTFVTYKKYFDKYEYTHALETIEKFFWHNFCDNYLELIKDQIFNPDKYSSEQIKNTKHTLYEVGFGILQLFAPFLPHITETLYQRLFKNNETENSIHTTIFNQERFNYDFKNDAEFMDKVIEIVSTVRKLKSEKQISLKTEIEQLNFYSEKKELLNKFKKQENLLRGITHAKEIGYKLGTTIIVGTINKSTIEQKDGNWFIQIKV